MTNTKVAQYKSTIELAKKAVALLSEKEQLAMASCAQSAIQAFIENKLDVNTRNTVFDVYNTINGLSSIPGILKGQVGDFCIEICDVIKNTLNGQKNNKEYIIPDDDKYALNMLLDLYIDVLFNVPAKYIHKATDIIRDRLSSNSGVTKV